MGEQLPDATPSPLLEDPFRALGVLSKLLQQCFRWCAKNLVDPVNLVGLILTRKQGVQRHDLKKDAPYAPNVHLVPIVSISQKALWGSVPSCGDVLCVGLQWTPQ